MNDTPGQPQQFHLPAPFVTHEQLGGVHRQIGALEKGQESLIAMYGHYRGEMLGQFDLLRQDLKKLTEQRALQQQEPQGGGLNLSVREAFIACFAIMAGTALITNMAQSSKPPVEAVRRAADFLVP